MSIRNYIAIHRIPLQFPSPFLKGCDKNGLTPRLVLHTHTTLYEKCICDTLYYSKHVYEAFESLNLRNCSI